MMPALVPALLRDMPKQPSMATMTTSRVHSRIAPQGDVIDVSGPGMPVQIVIGFRPAIDRLVMPVGETQTFRQDGDDIVIDCGANGLVVLQGLAHLC